MEAIPAAVQEAAVVLIHPAVQEAAIREAAAVLLPAVVVAVHRVVEVLHPDVDNSIYSKLMVELKLFMP